jgi:hypothetical protein
MQIDTINEYLHAGILINCYIKHVQINSRESSNMKKYWFLNNFPLHKSS